MKDPIHAYCVYYFDPDGEPVVLQTYPTFLQSQTGVYTWCEKKPNAMIDHGRISSLW